jgi:hypothetical protein
VFAARDAEVALGHGPRARAASAQTRTPSIAPRWIARSAPRRPLPQRRIRNARPQRATACSSHSAAEVRFARTGKTGPRTGSRS